MNPSYSPTHAGKFLISQLMIRLKYVVAVCFLLVSAHVSSQPLRDINFAYLYNSQEAFTFTMKPIRLARQWSVAYELRLLSDSLRTEDFEIHWETRHSLMDKEAVTHGVATNYKKLANSIHGAVTVALEAAPKLLVARVVRISLKRAWIFYKRLPENYPVDNYLESDGKILTTSFIHAGDSVTAGANDRNVVSYYRQDFPAALPTFSERVGRVSPAIRPDSTFSVSFGEAMKLYATGLYLVQRDTTATEGLSFRVEADYPRMSKVESLVGPMVYICTKQEYDRLVLAKGEKRTFDRVILNITNDTERARTLIRSYFRRVELANQYFTSYKEGWKTDRGMVMIVYGAPDEVFKFDDREVWTYKDYGNTTTFNFARSSSLFDPENYVLIRDEKYRLGWYETIDLWRSARF